MAFDLFDVVVDACRVQGLDPQPVGGYDHVVVAEVDRGDRRWRLFAEADGATPGVIVYSVLPYAVASTHRDEVAGFAVRVTYVLRYGDLEVDLDDGEVRVRTSVLVGAGPVALDVVAELIEHNVAIAETVFPLVERVAVGELSADEAFGVLAS
ncbi:hypothetical protein Afer_0281 [Acidimicrobium ferrooxidans DSM 10331]|uniref:Sensory transduction regulator n=1 Tax=Acidimicrobium ferrooxidans (strain DSM 10331 / JCM 15462 / NBRC 103882 / ICP) TaxID=525909 RepID=C7M2K6_ACIFD|nr:hypothetical protein [Acidimicrobium ferrooxidans]ACU53250.1 hypothetical protein Afer_0281 [Acidimicrobium ferrooxidans DSM 10331]